METLPSSAWDFRVVAGPSCTTESSLHTEDLLSQADARQGAALAALASSFLSKTIPAAKSLQNVRSFPYIPQASDWDCGLACVEMVQRSFGRTDSLSSVHLMFPTRSVWTIDLAHLLRASRLEIHYSTLTLGVNPGFSLEPFYQQQSADDYRVQKLFQEAEGRGICLRQRSVPESEIQSFLAEESCLIIALVDKNLLSLEQSMWTEFEYNGALEGGGQTFTGHYVVVHGYDKASEQYIVLDPDPGWGIRCVSRSSFNMARQSFGTDEDLLFVRASESEPKLT